MKPRNHVVIIFPLKNGGISSDETSRIFGGHFNFSKMNGGGISLNGGTKSNNHKTKVLRNLKVMSFKFCTVRHSILIFIKRILRPPPPQNYLSSQTNAIPQFIQSHHWIWWESYFKKMILGDMSEWDGGKKISGRGVARGWGFLPWMMPWKCGYKFIEDNHALEIHKFINASWSSIKML